MNEIHDYNIAEKVLTFRINGFVVFEDLISSEKIDRILEAWKPIRNADIKRQGENPLQRAKRLDAELKKKGTYKPSPLSELSSLMPAGPQSQAKGK